jgi:hypothetical protein
LNRDAATNTAGVVLVEQVGATIFAEREDERLVPDRKG